ncbi:MAG TPA: YeiH family protein [Gammaproteobacteria bacterium]|nr:YeiH family protein [Gammaproteobacteria bacterium]
MPGFTLCAAIAAASMLLHRAPGMGQISPLILAIIAGMVLRNTLGTPAIARPGIAFSLRRVLRLGVMLLGLQLTLTEVMEVGYGGLAIVLFTVVTTFAFTLWLGRLLGVDRKLTELLAAGTSICGASAVVATNAVIDGADEDVAYAVASVTFFGALSMMSYPALAAAFGLGAHGFGVWSGATIHEVAQVVATSFQVGPQAGQTATVVKLSRVLLLVPTMVVLGLGAQRRHGRPASRRAPLPWFVLGFLALVVVNTFLPQQAVFHAAAAGLTSFLLVTSLAAMGLETDARRLFAKGLKPLALGAAAWLFIAVTGLALVKLIG